MLEQQANEVSFALDYSILKDTPVTIDSCLGHLGGQRKINYKVKTLTFSGVKWPRSSVNLFLPSSLSSLYIALDNC